MKADLSACKYCGNKIVKNNLNKFCSKKCYWESKKGMTGYWAGKKRLDITGNNHYRWKGGPRICDCGNEIASRRKGVKICGDCRDKLLLNQSGKDHPNWKGGKPKCVDCGKKLSSYNSTRCKSCMGDNNRMDNNPNWKNGDEKKRLRSSPEYVSWRNAVFERDNYTCRGCGKRSVYLEAHHIKSFAEHKDLRFVINNGITYCEECHAKHDKYKRRFYV